jgi:hypothetical protein
MVGVENQKANATTGEMIADGQACLAASDNDGVDALGVT